MDPVAATAAGPTEEDTRHWWLFLVVGVLWILFGWIVLSFNYETVWAIAVFFGFGFILGGAAELMVAFDTSDWRWLHALFGIVAIIAGIMALVWPGETFLVLAAIIGWYVLFAGIFDIMAAFMIRDENDLWWLHLILGIAQVLIGFWAIGYTGRSIDLLVIWVGATALARGISSIFFGVGLHGAAKRMRGMMAKTPKAAPPTTLPPPAIS